MSGIIPYRGYRFRQIYAIESDSLPWYNAAMTKSPQERSVVVSLWSAGSCGRKQLAGVLDHVNRGHAWNVRIIMDPREFSADLIARAEADGVDGFIAFVNPENAAALAASRVPTVLMSYPQPVLTRRKRGLVLFLNRNEEIGRMGAEYLLSLGAFATYAFVPDTLGRGWSRLRERGFRARLGKAGFPCRVFRSGDLADWLAALPKPAAVMAPYDFRAKDVIEACNRLRLAVPDQVAVLGVDDDELICDFTRPSLSSIHLDQEAIGRKAAETLERLMSAKQPPKTSRCLLPTGKVVERASTKPLPPAQCLVQKIKAIVETGATGELTVNDVAARAGVSRRLADLRFRELTGTTIRRAIEERRLKEICRRLKETDLPIARIARQCGYANDLRAKYVFKSRFGCTMSEWRRQP